MFAVVVRVVTGEERDQWNMIRKRSALKEKKKRNGGAEEGNHRESQIYDLLGYEFLCHGIKMRDLMKESMTYVFSSTASKKRGRSFGMSDIPAVVKKV